MRALVLAAAAATLTACGSSEPEAPPAAAPADELAAVVEPLEATPEVIEESAAMSTMNGTVTYLMRRALHPEAVIRVRLEDISRADAPATVLAETRVEAAGRSVPIAWQLEYDADAIDARMVYAVRAEILGPEDTLMWTSDTVHPVLTREAPADNVEILVVPVRGR